MRDKREVGEVWPLLFATGGGRGMNGSDRTAAELFELTPAAELEYRIQTLASTTPTSGARPLDARTDIQLVLRRALDSRCPFKRGRDTCLPGLPPYCICDCPEEPETEDGAAREFGWGGRRRVGSLRGPGRRGEDVFERVGWGGRRVYR